MRLPANELAASAARKFVRAVLAERSAVPRSVNPSGAPATSGAASPMTSSAPRAISDRLIDDAVLLATEMVTNAILQAGTEIEVACRVETGPDTADSSTLHESDAWPMGVVVEVVDRRPSSAVDGGQDARRDVRGHGLQLLQALAESWGVTHRRGDKAMWFRLDTELGRDISLGGPPRHEPAATAAPAPSPARDRGDPASARADQEGPSFLAGASELLTGQLDEDMVAAIAGQLLVPRLADWCGVWLSTDRGGMRLSRVWHRDERRISALRRSLENDRPPTRLSTAAIPWPWPENPDATSVGGSALVFPLVAGGRCHGALMLGRAGQSQMTDGSVRLAEDVARRVAQALVTARHFTRQATISRVFQRRQLPTSLADIPGVDTALVYEPYGEGQTVGGDFYDVFPLGERRWCFLLGDVCGHDLEAMSATGLARHLVRLLAREGHGVESLLARLNAAMAEESAEAMAIGAEQAGQRFLSLLYGELEPDPAGGGAHCTLASAGHPLPLRLSADGTVAPAADPQMLLGIDETADFHANHVDLAPGETLLCVTDGVTERRRGDRQLDDQDGLAEVLRGCAGLGAKAVAERVRRAAHDFGTEPIDDDLAVLVLEAVPVLGAER